MLFQEILIVFFGYLIRADKSAKIRTVQTSVDLRSSLLTFGNKNKLSFLSLTRNLCIYQPEHPQILMPCIGSEERGKEEESILSNNYFRKNVW